ncbi:MAG: four helix bundle protein [Bacteroidales bacterium]|nr:four helix bundle protein [Bacteroidales bacterium]MBR4219429.1 four helix bundle protein [Bacteroidales bacterium]
MVPEQETSLNFFRFEDLRIYSKALDYVNWLHGVAVSIQDAYRESVVLPFLKSAQSVALSIAEGSSRNKAQFIYYLKMAKSAVRECVVYTTIASRLNLLNEDDKDYSRTQLMEMTKMIGSLVSSLQKLVPNAKDDDMEMA